MTPIIPYDRLLELWSVSMMATTEFATSDNTHPWDNGDREKAMSLLDESLTISNELGMRPLMERVLSRRDILKA